MRSFLFGIVAAGMLMVAGGAGVAVASPFFHGVGPEVEVAVRSGLGGFLSSGDVAGAVGWVEDCYDRERVGSLKMNRCIAGDLYLVALRDRGLLGLSAEDREWFFRSRIMRRRERYAYPRFGDGQNLKRHFRPVIDGLLSHPPGL